MGAEGSEEDALDFNSRVGIPGYGKSERVLRVLFAPFSFFCEGNAYGALFTAW